MARRIHARHFGGLAPDERASALAAAFSDTCNYLRSSIGLQFAGGKIVEEEERFSALRQNVIHTHGNEVDANCRVEVSFLSQQQLRADAICT